MGSAVVATHGESPQSFVVAITRFNAVSLRCHAAAGKVRLMPVIERLYMPKVPVLVDLQPSA
jgi:hypothetical protein